MPQGKGQQVRNHLGPAGSTLQQSSQRQVFQGTLEGDPLLGGSEDSKTLRNLEDLPWLVYNVGE